MKRFHWLVAIFAAAFVLQLPVCALACSTEPAVDAEATSQHAGCHEESSPQEPTQSDHEDCCEAVRSATVQTAATGTAADLTFAAVLVPAGAATATPRTLRSVATNHRVPEPPPPDVLSLTSTLLF